MAEQYTEEISRSHPVTVIFLVDQSGSMDDPFGGAVGISKGQYTADALNRLIATMVTINTVGDEIYDRLNISVIGYGGDSVSTAFGGDLADKKVIPLSEIGDRPVRIEKRRMKVPDGAGGILEVENPFPIWIEPRADGVTPMKRAFEFAREIVSDSIAQYPESYPPTIINITDGAYTPPGQAGDPKPIVEAIKSMININGSKPLVYNCHITHSSIPAVLYPSSHEQLDDEYAKELFSMSSSLPASLVSAAGAAKFEGIREGSRGFVFNADAVQLVEFLDWGTRKATGEIRPGHEVRPGIEETTGEAEAEVETRPGSEYLE
ncbi:MAG: vWA domain-containing protein [Desulfomonilaceae bacterium]